MSAYSVRKTEVNPTNNEKVEVLYQRISGRWYAFSEKNNEVFYGTIPEEVLTELEDHYSNFSDSTP
jgi:hypothetical protein